MANQTRRPKKQLDRSGLPVPLFLFAAFALGVSTTWLLMRGSSSAPPAPAIQDFLPSPASQPNEASIPANPTGPPDVTNLPPADSARTLANWNYDRQDWTHAIEHYQDAIARGADNPDVRTDLGNCYRFLGQPQKALEQYQVAQRQNPLHENSLFNQISLFAQFLHDNAHAESAARDFLARFPLSPQAAAAKQLLSKSEGAGDGDGKTPK